MDVGNEITGGYQDEDADEQGDKVEEGDEGEVQFHWCLADVVHWRVERDEARVLLQQHDADTQNVAPEHALSDDEDWEP